MAEAILMKTLLRQMLQDFTCYLIAAKKDEIDEFGALF